MKLDKEGNTTYFGEFSLCLFWFVCFLSFFLVQYREVEVGVYMG